MKKLLTAFILTLLLSATAMAFAHSYQLGAIHVGHVWTRATPQGSTVAAVYMPLLNTGTESDSLTAASSDLAEKIEIHQDSNENGIMKMSRLDAVMLEPGKPVTLKPGGIHLMVFGLKTQLKEGGRFPLSLTFAKAGTIQVEAVIAAADAMSGEVSDEISEPMAH